MTNASNRGIALVLFNVGNTCASKNNIFNELHAKDEIQRRLATTDFPVGYYYRAIEQTAGHPWLALFPIPDLTNLETDSLIPTQVERELLPGGKSHGMKSRDVRYYRYLDTWEIPTTKEGKFTFGAPLTVVFLDKAAKSELGRGLYVLITSIEPGPGDEKDLDDWYRHEHLAALATSTGYRRATRYRLRKDGGKTGEGEDIAMLRELPTWLVLYEFDSPPDRRELILHRQSEWSQNILRNARLETGIYKMEASVGDRDIAL